VPDKEWDVSAPAHEDPTSRLESTVFPKLIHNLGSPFFLLFALGAFDLLFLGEH
jgi:hypothetical protein